MENTTTQISSISDPQLVIIEDDIEIAQEITPFIQKHVNQVAYVIDEDVLKRFLAQKNQLRVFLVDINLGGGRKEAGYEMIRIIKDRAPRNLVIVYTANGDRDECMKAGADHFILKGGSKRSEAFREINRLIEEHLLQYQFYASSISVYEGEVANIDRENNLIMIEYANEEEDAIVEWEVETEQLSHIKNLSAGTRLKVIVKKTQDGYKVSFEKLDKPPDRYINENYRNLSDSKIFSNKPPEE